MIEPTEGEIVDVLNNYLNSGSRDTFHQILIGRAIAEIKHLRMRVADLKNGFEGSCTACEPVAEMNKKLVQYLKSWTLTVEQEQDGMDLQLHPLNREVCGTKEHLGEQMDFTSNFLSTFWQIHPSIC